MNGQYRLIKMFVSKVQINILSVLIVVVIFGLFITFLNIYELHRLTKGVNNCSQYPLYLKNNNSTGSKENTSNPTVWLRSKKKKKDGLKHVANAFKAYDYRVAYFDNTTVVDEENWDVMWSHNFPFIELKTYLRNLKKKHCINHFPGTGFITTKVYLATSNYSFVPKAFRMPGERVQLETFASVNPKMMFVHKSNDHRGIKIETIDKINLNSKETFVQQFIQNPLLVDGHKFDIGVYTILTSVDPLRVYIFDDVLFRFCPEKYHPFSADRPNKYVVGDDYLPTWKVDSLKHFYIDQGLGMKATFDSWLRETGKNPAVIWDQVSSAISEVFYTKESLLMAYKKYYPKNLRFFEVMRFDFIIDENFRVYLMEANMSPNLSSAHFTENRLLYEQVVFNTLSLIGLSYQACLNSHNTINEEEMRVAYKDVAVFSEHCKAVCSDKMSCLQPTCQLCRPCMIPSLENDLKQAFLEHSWKGSCKRVVPKPIKRTDADAPVDSQSLSPSNTLMTEWFRGKCLNDISFC